jgi:hypothetical protein
MFAVGLMTDCLVVARGPYLLMHHRSEIVHTRIHGYESKTLRLFGHPLIEEKHLSCGQLTSVYWFSPSGGLFYHSISVFWAG